MIKIEVAAVEQQVSTNQIFRKLRMQVIEKVPADYEKSDIPDIRVEFNAIYWYPLGRPLFLLAKRFESNWFRWLKEIRAGEVFLNEREQAGHRHSKLSILVKVLHAWSQEVLELVTVDDFEPFAGVDFVETFIARLLRN